jgi:hypothetical protein
VLILWAWTLLLSGFVLFPLYVSSVNAVIPFGVLALGVVLFTLFHPGLRRRSAMEHDEEPLPLEEPASEPVDTVPGPPNGRDPTVPAAADPPAPPVDAQPGGEPDGARVGSTPIGTIADQGLDRPSAPTPAVLPGPGNEL